MSDLLFHDRDLRALMEHQMNRIQDEVNQADEKYLLNVDKDEWASSLAGQATIDVPELDVDGQTLEDLGEVRVDVSNDWSRDIRDPANAHVPGRAVVVRIPFSGEPEMFNFRASRYTMNPPSALVRSGYLAFRFDFASSQVPDIKSQVDESVRSIQEHLEWQRSDVESHNKSVHAAAIRAIDSRRERVLADKDHLAGLGIPMKIREDAPTTYAAPGIARRKSPVANTKGAKPKAPEPIMVDTFYDHICDLTRTWGRAIERSPGTHGSFGEEALRDQLLVNLNSHYEGRATGETFQGAGKTDVLVRVEDRNVFIGECKWWSGPKAFGEALDQLFSYTTWRDAKLSLIFFVKAKDFTKVVASAKEALEQSPVFVDFERTDDSEFRARMKWPGDDDKTVTLTVFLFHLGAPA